MKKTLQKLRSQQPHVRTMIAFVSAGVLTAVIAAIWLALLATSGDREGAVVKAPSPLGGFISSVKGVVGRSRFGASNSNVRIINADDPDAATVPSAAPDPSAQSSQ